MVKESAITHGLWICVPHKVHNHISLYAGILDRPERGLESD